MALSKGKTENKESSARTIESVSNTLKQYYPEMVGLNQHQLSCDLSGSYLGVEFRIDIFSIHDGRPDWIEHLYSVVSQQLDKIAAGKYATV